MATAFGMPFSASDMCENVWEDSGLKGAVTNSIFNK
jgi:hypothetical protein